MSDLTATQNTALQAFTNLVTGEVGDLTIITGDGEVNLSANVFVQTGNLAVDMADSDPSTWSDLADRYAAHNSSGILINNMDLAVHARTTGGSNGDHYITGSAVARQIARGVAETVAAAVKGAL